MEISQSSGPLSSCGNNLVKTYLPQTGFDKCKHASNQPCFLPPESIEKRVATPWALAKFTSWNGRFAFALPRTPRSTLEAVSIVLAFEVQMFCIKCLLLRNSRAVCIWIYKTCRTKGRFGMNGLVVFDCVSAARTNSVRYSIHSLRESESRWN